MRAARLHAARLPATTIALVTLLLTIPPTIRAVDWGITAGKTDTRYSALDWIKSNVPREARVVREWHTPPLAQAGYSEIAVRKVDDHPLEWYRAAGAEYVVLSSFMYQRYLDDPGAYPANAAFYERLLALPREATFTGENGPVIVILRLDAAAPAFAGN